MTSSTQRLPLTALGAPALQSDVLAEHLAHLKEYLISPADARGALALMAHWPFDPNATLARRGGRESFEPVLTQVLQRLPRLERSGPRADDRAWPGQVGLFGAALLQKRTAPDGTAFHDQVDGEWLAAVLLAAGADPWHGRSAEQPLGKNLTTALARGYGSLARRMMEIPGGPSWDQVANADCSNENVDGVSGFVPKTWWTASAASPRLVAVFEQLLHHRVPWPEEGPHPLEQASPQAVALCFQHGRLPDQPALVRRLRTAWSARLRAGQLPAKDYTRMEAALTAPALSAAQGLATDLQREREAEAQQALNKYEWGSRSSLSYQEYTCREAARWCERVTVKGTSATHGTWNPLAITWMQALRRLCAGDKALTKWDLQTSLTDAGPHPENAAPLAAALGFDWRPGVPIDGLAWLAIHGTGTHGQELSLKNAQLLGVDEASDPGWVERHAVSAVAFTEAVLDRASALAHKNMTTVWIASTSTPQARHALGADPALLTRLVRALHRNFSLSADHTSQIVNLVDQLVQPPGAGRAKALHELWLWQSQEPAATSPWRALWLELHLLRGEAAQALRFVQSRRLTQDEAQRVTARLTAWEKELAKQNGWVDSQTRPTMDALAKALRQQNMERALPPAAPKASRSGPRM